MTQDRPAEQALPETADRAGDPRADSPATRDVQPPAASPPPAASNALKQAMRRARHDDAERMGAVADLRIARIGRLELLEDALEPLQAQIPEDVDLFDFGLMAGANPRLFLDMIGFVEMGRDARTYRLVQDTRHGRKLLAESDSLPCMVDAVTDYVARRLLERDKALAAEDLEVPASHPVAAGADVATPRQRAPRIAGAAFAFLIDLLGVITLCTIVFVILYYAALQTWPKLSELWPQLVELMSRLLGQV